MNFLHPLWLQGSKMVMPERMKPYAGRGHPNPCEVCRQSIKQKLGFEAGQVNSGHVTADCFSWASSRDARIRVS